MPLRRQWMQVDVILVTTKNIMKHNKKSSIKKHSTQTITSGRVITFYSRGNPLMKGIPVPTRLLYSTYSSPKN